MLSELMNIYEKSLSRASENASSEDQNSPRQTKKIYISLISYCLMNFRWRKIIMVIILIVLFLLLDSFIENGFLETHHRFY